MGSLSAQVQYGTRRQKASWLALFFLVALLFPVRLEYGWAFFSTISVLDPVLILLLGWLVLLVLLAGWITVGNRRVFLVLILPVVFALLSLLWSMDPAQTVKSIVVYGAAVVSYLVALALFRDWSVARLLKMTMSASWVLVLTAVLSYIPGSPLAPEITFAYQDLEGTAFLRSYYARFSHPFLGLSNSFATILAMLLPIVLIGSRIGVWPRFATATAVMLTAAILVTGSRGVLMALLLVFGMLGIWRLVAAGSMSRRFLNNSFLGCGGIVALVAAFVVLSPAALEHAAGRLDFSNIDARLHAFAAALDVSIFEYPLGIGSGVALSAVSELGTRSVHNAYLQNILWFGLVLGILLSAAMLLLPYIIWKMRVSTPTARHVRAAVATSAALLILVNLSQASWEGSVLRIWIYVLLAIGMVMIRRSDKVLPRRMHAKIS